MRSKADKKRERRERRERRGRTIRNIAIALVAAAVVGAVISYNYSAEQTKQRGLEFGIKLQGIQDDVREIQTEFYSEKTKWEEGDLDREGLLEFYGGHIERFEDTILRYDELEPPEIFEGSVRLLKLSSQSQLESDSEYVRWISDGDDSARARSDALLQDALEYELLGLVEFYSAKTGTITRDDTGEKFQEPRHDVIQKVDSVAEHMIAECDEKFGAGGGATAVQDGDTNATTASKAAGPEWIACVSEAEEWRQSHMP